MTWFKVDDAFAFHGKAVAAGNAALGLWVRAGSWSMQTLTGGIVPDRMVSALGNTAQARNLVTAGLWERIEGGYRFHGWDDYQPSRTEVEADRAAAKERQRRAREKAKSRRDAGVSHGVTNGVTYGGVTPVVTVPPSRPVLKEPKTPSSAAADGAFETFWNLYPKKVEKQAAKKKWDATIKRVDPDEILAGLRRYLAWWQRKGTERQFIKGPEVWLNKGCWADELEDEPGSTAVDSQSGSWFPGA